ncbi:DarT ssDNA thymidine ADP-ribosyltransferase family protein [Loktanella sp. DJP18]|uniref:DarT ssDNA thymidine ADP-ribosyltransferase family protein n=1 Tax=Loktanella sp. DJP18 TaxID=3409788 RepID=UPI003BB55BA9
MNNGQRIQRAANARGIACLVHFTPAVNAMSILTHGLASRPTLDEAGIDYAYTDDWRGDGKMDAVCLSISQIYLSMLASKRKVYNGEWVVFLLDASILWTHNCRFCWTNAASREIRNHRGFLGGPWGFDEMFAPRPVSMIDATCRRTAYSLADDVTTDNAAEVQVFDQIDSDLILGVGVQSEWHKTRMENMMLDIDRVRPVEVFDQIFK